MEEDFNNKKEKLSFWQFLGVLKWLVFFNFKISIFGSTMGSQSEFSNMLDFINENKIVPIVDSVYNMADFNSAFKRMESKQQFGKIVLNISR